MLELLMCGARGSVFLCSSIAIDARISSLHPLVCAHGDTLKP